jgi:simple sugar transport system permease protein
MAAIERIRSVNLLRGILRLAIVIAATVVVLPLLGINLFEALPSVYRGTIANPYALSQTMTIAAVLTLAAAAALIPVRAGFVNLGGEGQITMGALGATAVVLGIGGKGSLGIAVLALVIAVVVGSVWGGISSFLFEAFGANAVITTLMFNYIAFAIADYARSTVWPDSTAPQTKPVPEGDALPEVGPYAAAPIAIFIVLVVWIFVILLFKRTNFGFRIRATGENPLAAARFGYRPVQTRIVSVIIGGGLAGLGGGLLVLILNRALTPAVAANYGYVGIAAALLIGLRPSLLPLGAILFAVMTVGGGTLAAVARVSPDVSFVGVAAAVMVFLATQSRRSGSTV